MENKDFNDLFGSEFFKKFFSIDGEWKEEKIEYPGGSMTFKYRVYDFKNDVKSESNIDLKSLENELKNAVEVEDYLKAAEIKKKIDSLKENKEELIRLRSEIDKAVKAEDYLKAAEFKKLLDEKVGKL